MTVVLTGGSSGIGAAAALQLAAKGLPALIAGRDRQRLDAVWQRMRQAAPPGLFFPEPWAGDLSDPDQVRALAERAHQLSGPITALVNNAGVECASRRTNPQGHEYCFAVNHLAPFLLTRLLLGRLEKDGARIVTTASSNHAQGGLDLEDLAHQQGWTPMAAYNRSKLANVLFTLALRRRTPLATTCFHPGSITTRLNRESPTYIREKAVEFFTFARPSSGAKTLVWLVASDEMESPKAPYYEKCRPAPICGLANDEALAERLFEASERLLELPRLAPLG